MNIENINWEKVNGLIPAVIQNETTKKFLMLGYMNSEALDKTLSTKKVTFFSRTKERLWTKGETSGNTLDLRDIKLDCDGDTLLIQVDPKGPTCHTGTETCFDGFKLETLQEVIKKRANATEETSYTKQLLGKPDKMIQKIGEEATEVVIAAKNEDREEIISEVSDLFYHTLVMLRKNNIELDDIYAKLSERHNG